MSFTVPLPPLHRDSFIIGPAVKKTHTQTTHTSTRRGTALQRREDRANGGGQRRESAQSGKRPISQLTARRRARVRPPPGVTEEEFTEVYVSLNFNHTPADRRRLVTVPADCLMGLWAIPSTESDPQPLLVTYNPSSLPLTPSPPPHSVFMYVGMGFLYMLGYVMDDRVSMLVHR
jgi:hypothetical protein